MITLPKKHILFEIKQKKQICHQIKRFESGDERPISQKQNNFENRRKKIRSKNLSELNKPDILVFPRISKRF